MQRIRITFTKADEIKFISHLDILKALERALRRSNLPIVYSQGFNPRMKMSYALPTSLGMSSNAELVDLYFEESPEPKVIQDKLNATLPPGMKVLEAQEVDLRIPSLTSQIKEVVYLINGQDELRVQTGQKLKELKAALNVQSIQRIKFVLTNS